MVAIPDGSLVDERAVESVRTCDRRINFRVLDAMLLGEGQEEEAVDSRAIQPAVSWIGSVKFTAVKHRPGEGVAPRAAAALAHGGLHGPFLQGRKHVLVSRAVVVDRAGKSHEPDGPSKLPAWRLHHVDRAGKFWLPLFAVGAPHPVMHELAVLGFA